MASHDLDRLLNEAADFVEGNIRQLGLEEELREECYAGQTPYALRTLQQPSDCELLVLIRAREPATEA